MIAAITELHIRNFLGYVRFIPHAVKSKTQADRAQGLISIRLKSDGLLIQRTLTVWKDRESMVNYYRSGAHLDAMKSFTKIAKTSYSLSYEVDSEPTWESAIKTLREKGRVHHST